MSLFFARPRADVVAADIPPRILELTRTVEMQDPTWIELIGLPPET